VRVFEVEEGCGAEAMAVGRVVDCDRGTRFGCDVAEAIVTRVGDMRESRIVKKTAEEEVDGILVSLVEAGGW